MTKDWFMDLSSRYIQYNIWIDILHIIISFIGLIVVIVLVPKIYKWMCLKNKEAEEKERNSKSPIFYND